MEPSLAVNQNVVWLIMISYFRNNWSTVAVFSLTYSVQHYNVYLRWLLIIAHLEDLFKVNDWKRQTWGEII